MTRELINVELYVNDYDHEDQFVTVNELIKQLAEEIDTLQRRKYNKPYLVVAITDDSKEPIVFIQKDKEVILSLTEHAMKDLYFGKTRVDLECVNTAAEATAKACTYLTM